MMNSVLWASGLNFTRQQSTGFSSYIGSRCPQSLVSVLSPFRFTLKCFCWTQASWRVDVHNTTFGQQKAFRIQYLNIATDSLGENPVLMLSLWLCLQCFLQSVRQEATRSSRTPTVAPPSAPAGCSSHPCRTSSVTTPSHRAGTSFRFLTSQRVCPPSVWR